MINRRIACEALTLAPYKYAMRHTLRQVTYDDLHAHIEGVDAHVRIVTRRRDRVKEEEARRSRQIDKLLAGDSGAGRRTAKKRVR